MDAHEGGGGRLEYRVEIWGEPPASVHICVTFLNKQTNKQPTREQTGSSRDAVTYLSVLQSGTLSVVVMRHTCTLCQC